LRVLVTGGAGFIGSHVAEALVARGDAVVVLDDLSNGLVENVPDGAVFVRGDVRDRADIARAFDAFGSLGDGSPADSVAHIAGQASTFKSFDSPSWDIEVNGVGTARMLEASRERGVRTFLFASSMTAYGPPAALPVREEFPCAAISFYGVTKYAAERAVMIASTHSEGAMRAVAFRMFNVFGPRQSLTNPYQGVMGIFLGRVLRGEEIVIFGDGEQSRDFVYVGDVAAAWLKALDAPPDEPTALNLGTGTRITMNDLWRRVALLCGRAPESYPHRHEAVRPGDQRHMQADITRADEVLGWRPSTSLDEGLARTVAWARRVLDERGRG
jgi:UDP-glucose 4-epimerase